MSVYQVGKLVFDLNRQPALVEQFQKEPEPFLERYRLSDEEKKAIRDKDLRFLYELGLNPYLVMGMARLLKIENRDYIAAIAGAKPHPDLKTVSFPGPALKGDYLIRED